MKCCFYGQNWVIDRNISALIDKKLEALVASNDEIEFYFTKYVSDYLDICIERVNDLIMNHPTKSIKAFLCIFPDEKPADFSHYLSFPHETLLIPEEYMIKHIAHHSFNIEAKKRWLLNQCDQIISYFYAEMYDGVNSPFKLSEQHRFQLQPIYEQETSDFLLDSYSRLSERESGILLAIQQELTLNEIGQMYNISRNRVHQIAVAGSRKLHRLAIRRCIEQHEQEEWERERKELEKEGSLSE